MIIVKFKRKLSWANSKQSGVRVNIPSEILDLLDTKVGDSIQFNITDKKEITLTKVKK